MSTTRNPTFGDKPRVYNKKVVAQWALVKAMGEYFTLLHPDDRMDILTSRELVSFLEAVLKINAKGRYEFDLVTAMQLNLPEPSNAPKVELETHVDEEAEMRSKQNSLCVIRRKSFDAINGDIVFDYYCDSNTTKEYWSVIEDASLCTFLDSQAAHSYLSGGLFFSNIKEDCAVVRWTSVKPPKSIL